MNNDHSNFGHLDIWWAIPNELAGMPMPFIHPDRHDNPTSRLDEYPDELPDLSAAGIKSIICLLNMKSVVSLYGSTGFTTYWLPISDGGIPAENQFNEVVSFIDEQRSSYRPTAIHCEAGIGRTGTVLAGYLIAKGASLSDSIRIIRAARPGAIESDQQMDFLIRLSRTSV